MRIRSIRPEFWTSEDIAALDWDTRLIFIGLWSYVDDNGVGRDVDKLIVADLFPLEDDPRETLATVHRALSVLSDRFLITRYMADGKPYLHITTWEKHQKIDRPGKGRYPLPTSEDTRPREILATPSREVRETPSTGEGEKGRSLLVSDAPRPDVDELCDRLLGHLVAKDVKAEITKDWRDQARLLLDRDGRDLDEARRLIDWCQADEFWGKNILGMPKFRKQYDQLRLKANLRPASNGHGTVSSGHGIKGKIPAAWS